MRQIYFNEYNIAVGNSIFLPYTSGLLQVYAQQEDRIKDNYEFKTILFQKDTVETKVLDAYMRMTGYDFKKLASQTAANDKVIKLKSTKQTVNGKIVLIKSPTGTITAGDIA